MPLDAVLGAGFQPIKGNGGTGGIVVAPVVVSCDVPGT